MSIAAFSMVAIVVVVGCGIWTHNRFVALRQPDDQRKHTGAQEAKQRV